MADKRLYVVDGRLVRASSPGNAEVVYMRAVRAKLTTPVLATQDDIFRIAADGGTIVEEPEASPMDPGPLESGDE